MKLFILLAIVKRLRVSNTRLDSQKTLKPVHGNKMQKIENTATSHTYVQYKRGRQCPAHGHRCKHCSREHHFDQMCRSRNTTSNCTTSEEHEDTVFNTLCSATSVHSIGNRCSISLDHHLYNNICDQWLQRSSQQQPFIKMKVAIHPDDYTALGFNLSGPPKTFQVQVVADTGCQSCLAGITILDQLCISRRTSSQ